MLEGMNLAILIGAALIAVSIATSVLSSRLGAPLLLIFLAMGLLAGEDGLGLEFDNTTAAYLIGTLALAVILFDSGFGTGLRSLRLALAPAVLLATVGVALTAAFTAVAAHWLLGFGWIEALLLGSIIGSTDAAAVFFLLRVGGITLRERVRATLEVESGSNDPMAIFLTLTLVGLAASQESGADVGWTLLQAFMLQIGFGTVLGLAGGWLIVWILRRVTFEEGLYPIAILSLALSLFAVTNMVGGSGFVAVYLAGIISGNAKLPRTVPLRRFQEGMTWLAQIVMFLTLGLLATPSEFVGLLVPAVLLGLFLILIARPLTILLCVPPFGFSRQETAFIAWVGLRGAVSILLAILPLAYGLPDGRTMFNIIFLMVLTSLIVQGWTVRLAARRLGLLLPPRHGPLERLDLELPGTPDLELVVYHLIEGSPVVTGERLPRWARPSLVVRGGRRFDVHSAGRLQPGDYVYIFAAPRRVALLDRLFASPVQLSLDDRELFGDFVLSPKARLAEIGQAYGFESTGSDSDLTLGELLQREFGAGIGIGDRLTRGPMELVVRALDAEQRVTEVGLVLDPGGAAAALPLPGRQMLRRLRARWRRRRGQQEPVADVTATGTRPTTPSISTGLDAQIPPEPGTREVDHPVESARLLK